MSENYLAVDPGLTTGWAVLEKGIPLAAGEMPFDEVWEWIESLTFGLYVVEDYIIRPATVQKGYSHQWNKGEALQVIGALKYHAYRSGAELVLQQPSIKPMAAKMTGLPYDKNKSGTHMQDAVLHGAFFWRKEHGVAQDAAEAGGGDSPRQGVRNPARVRQIDSWSGLREKRRR